MTIPTHARKWGVRLFKVALFLLIGMGVGRALGNPEIYVNHEFASTVCNFIYGDVNAETSYDTYFYIDVLTVVSITTAFYLIFIILIRTAKSK
ncbi:hypothetical protein GJV06_09055 [Enterobacteriaceae bacterium RIT691]|nr:hypothetical protein [Enterobacteriaceae bacterium RIT691]